MTYLSDLIRSDQMMDGDEIVFVINEFGSISSKVDQDKILHVLFLLCIYFFLITHLSSFSFNSFPLVYPCHDVAPCFVWKPSKSIVRK